MAAPPPKKRGAPFKPEGATKSARLELRVNPADRARWQAAADAAGLSLNRWIERACDAATASPPPPAA